MSAVLLGITGSVATSVPAQAAFINNSCGPNFTWTHIPASDRFDVAWFNIGGTSTRVALRSGFGSNLHWASVSNAPAGTRVWMDWTDNLVDWHRCGNGSSGWVTVPSGSTSASTRAVNWVDGRWFRPCANRPGGANWCTTEWWASFDGVFVSATP